MQFFQKVLRVTAYNDVQCLQINRQTAYQKQYFKKNLLARPNKEKIIFNCRVLLFKSKNFWKGSIFLCTDIQLIFNRNIFNPLVVWYK